MASCVVEREKKRGRGREGKREREKKDRARVKWKQSGRERKRQREKGNIQVETTASVELPFCQPVSCTRYFKQVMNGSGVHLDEVHDSWLLYC